MVDKTLKRDWQYLRSAFNHDWLKNVYLPALDSWVSILSGEIQDPHFEAKFLSGRFREWAEHRCEARRLLEDFEVEMTPETLFDGAPLQRLGERDRDWLRNVVHEAWRARTGHGAVLREIEMSLEAANAVFDDLEEEIDRVEVSSAEDLRALRGRFAELASHCRDLGRAMSQLPNKVLVA